MSQWKWNDVELEIDMVDVEFQQKIEDAYNKMEAEEDNLSKVGRASEITLGYCNMFYNFFDRVFGSGTGEKLLGTKKNARICDECYGSFFDFMRLEVEKSNKRRTQCAQKYKVKSKR